jgi:hypothetical protein
VLHIGFEKTGTKAIQYWLRDHEDLLAERGIRFPRGWLRLNVHQELPLCLMQFDRLCSPRELGDEWRDARWRSDVLDQIAVDLARHRGERTVLSSENLDLLRFDVEFAALRALVGDAAIVVYLREPVDWVEALRWQYLHKNAPGRTLSEDPESYSYLGPGTWRSDYDTLLSGWRRWFSRVRVMDYDWAVAAEGSVIPSFLRYLDRRLPAVDVHAYNLNRRGEPTPRTPGNRSYGLPFGDAPVNEAQADGMFLQTSTPAN